MARKKGFTIIELMVLVVLITVLITISIANYKNFTKKAKSAEVKSNLGNIRSHEESYYLENLTYLACPPHPAVPPAAVTTTWKATEVPAEWEELGFEIKGDMYYSYEVQTADTGQSFTAIARGDLDGDSVYSVFSFNSVDGNIAESLPLE